MVPFEVNLLFTNVLLDRIINVMSRKIDGQ